MTAHSKLSAATAQLKTAVFLFVSDQDRVSSITLAGAADVILSQLLLNAGKPNFSDQLIKFDADKTGVNSTRSEHGRAVNDMLMINALKHMDSGDDDYVEMDLFVSSMACGPHLFDRGGQCGRQGRYGIIDSWWRYSKSFCSC